MGNAVSTAGKYIVRKSRRYNVENRALRYIEQEKIPPAPKHPNTAELIEKITKDPIVQEELTTKNIQLNEKLKQVYVTSLHKTPMTFDEEIEKKKKSKLPQARGIIEEDTKFGYDLPVVIPKGKFTLSQALEFMTAHHADPEINSVKVISEHYNVDERVIKSVIEHFKSFRFEVKNTEVDQKLEARKLMSRLSIDTMKLTYELSDVQRDIKNKSLGDALKEEEKIRLEEMNQYSKSLNRNEKPIESIKDKIFGNKSISDTKPK